MELEPSETLPSCDPFRHQWQEHYYGWQCAVCAVFIPFGFEPWAPDAGVEEDEEEDCNASAK